MFYLVAFFVFAIDLSIKAAASTFLAPAGSVPIIKGFLHLTYVLNSGVAFGLFPDQRLPLVLIGVAICAIVIYFYASAKKEEILLKIYLAIIMGGSLGNLFDRVFFGRVIDYIDFRVFPVFNFADIAINLGVFLIIFDLFLKRK
ncbi:MAG: signal peptidase II [bacterium]